MSPQNNKKNIVARIAIFSLDLLEIYVPALAFTVMFLLFIVQIFFRYFLDDPLTWPYELKIFGFIWTTILGACLAKRTGAHVKFGLIYDKLKPPGQLIFRLIGNGLILLAFAIAFLPTYDYIQFLAFQKSSVLRIPFNIAFFPYVIFMVLIMGHTAFDLVTDIKKLIQREV